jgi:hypothetical protein
LRFAVPVHTDGDNEHPGLQLHAIFGRHHAEPLLDLDFIWFCRQTALAILGGHRAEIILVRVKLETMRDFNRAIRIGKVLELWRSRGSLESALTVLVGDPPFELLADATALIVVDFDSKLDIVAGPFALRNKLDGWDGT